MTKSESSKIGVTTLKDISLLILRSHDLDETLRNVVNLVARRMGTDVCSIYLLDNDQETLRLRATKGLSRRAVGRVTMRIGEGLTGMAAQKRHAVAIEEPEKHPRFRYFKETGEEREDFSYGTGCQTCYHTGYRGRTGIFEILTMSDQLRMMVLNNTSPDQLRHQAIEEGMITLIKDGMYKVKEGITTPSEVLRNAYSVE